MARLSLSLLGSLEITLDGQPVDGFTYDKVRALLVYLAVEAHRAHYRDTLAELLWPDRPAELARKSLRQALAILRQVLGDEVAAVPFVIATRETLQLNPASDYELDARMFTAALVACDRHAHCRLDRCRACAQRMEQALALYRDPFLAHFSLADSVAFEEWALLKREELQRHAFHALAALTSYFERRAAYDLAERYVAREVQLDPWREEAQRQLMRVLALSGQRGAALRQYETCRHILQTEFGVEPAVETDALEERIRNGELDDRTVRPGKPDGLPAQSTSFVGRIVELAELVEQLSTLPCRLITVIGSPGIGKTRLAMEVAADMALDFDDGVAFVALAPIADPQMVLPAVAQALNVKEEVGQPLLETLKRYLRDRHLLLVLDNFEHVLDAAPDIAALLAAAPHLKIMATSRAALHVSGEHEFAVPPLRLPDPRLPASTAQLAAYEAVSLFIARARAVRRDFEMTDANAGTIAAICRRLDGLPLAIELAVARIKVLEPEALLGRLDSRLQFLTGGSRDLPARQQTIRATVDWSYNLLSPSEQHLFARLAVFVGGWTLEAAEMVCGVDGAIDVLDGLQSLVDKSLVRQEAAVARSGQAQTRFQWLEMLREYAGEHLDANGEAERMRRHHAEYFLTLVEAAESRFAGAEGRVRLDPLELDRLELEQDNLRAALRWALDHAAPALGLRLATAVESFWTAWGSWSEASFWLEAALERADLDHLTPLVPHAVSLRAKALCSAGRALRFAGQPVLGRTRVEEGLRLFQQLDDKQGIALALRELGWMVSFEGDQAQSQALFAASLAASRQAGDSHTTAGTLRRLAHCLLGVDHNAATEALEEALALFRQAGDASGMAITLESLGSVARDQGAYARAMLLFEEGLALARQSGARGVAATLLHCMGETAMLQGDDAAALVYEEQGLALFRDTGEANGAGYTLINLGWLAQHQGDVVRMAACFEESLRIYRALRARWAIKVCLAGLAGVAMMEVQSRVEPAHTEDAHRCAMRSARLFGASAAIENYIFPAHIVEIERNLAAARSLVDEACWEAAWNAGQAMSMEQAIAYALGEHPLE